MSCSCDSAVTVPGQCPLTYHQSLSLKPTLVVSLSITLSILYIILTIFMATPSIVTITCSPYKTHPARPVFFRFLFQSTSLFLMICSNFFHPIIFCIFELEIDCRLLFKYWIHSGKKSIPNITFLIISLSLNIYDIWLYVLYINVYF